MNVNESRIDSFILVQISGRVDSLSSESLKDRLQELGGREERVLIDCTAMDYIGSAGLGALLTLLKLIQNKRGTLRLFGLQPRIAEVFAIAGFDRLFPIFPTLDAARAAAT